jgi:hypothetical protein
MDIATKMFNKAAFRFEAIGIETVVFGAFDRVTNQVPNGLVFHGKLPQMIFYPAYHKTPPHKRPTDVRTKELMTWIEKYAD